MRNDMPSRLRALLASDLPVRTGPAYDGLTTRIACETGFDAVSVGGYAVAASMGYPDVGLVTMTELLSAYRNCTRVSSVPVIGDADTGFGNAVNVMRAVQEFEDNGLAGMQIEDQQFPKQCPFLGSSTLISLDEAVGKIKAAVAARRNPDFVIKARTDATNLEEAIVRGKAYVEAGADVIYGINKCFPDIDAIRHFRQAVGVPIGFSILGWTESLTHEEVDSVGSCVVGWPFALILSVAGGAHENLKQLKEGKKVSDLTAPMMRRETLEGMLNIDDVRETHRLYIPD
ncbi:oxaloacetate decarboxylase [Pusillimonas sp. SM2304]|uniref:isocitrate lyase/PEP mutase family protein n=1 Tax=Pusillimonas sp. SM2304 TaxID=3073241 RepID=UPI00287700D4|nr:oxaloacetate decarboxylase [Pusillimonas sp. SM2304]MDS1140113.1 oxaloacetate decarboxylase [Pusillimonas sp. SM2304]